MLGGQLCTRIVFVGNLSICPRMKVSEIVGRYGVTTQRRVSDPSEAFLNALSMRSVGEIFVFLTARLPRFLSQPELYARSRH